MVLPWRLKSWNGSAWVDAELRRWSGTSWVNADMYFWDGVQWVLCTDRTPPTSTHNDFFNITNHQEYQGHNGVGRTGEGRLYQGYFDGVWGEQKSIMIFDWGAIDAALSGRTANYSAQIRLNNDHTYFNGGGAAIIGTHTHPDIPATFSYNRFNFHTEAFAKGQDKFFGVTTDLMQWFDEQSARGLTLYAGNFDAFYYGYFGANETQLFFSYEK